MIDPVTQRQIQLMPDIPRYYTAIAQWLGCLVFIFSVKCKPDRRRAAGAMAGLLAVLIVFLQATKDVPLWLWVPCMAVSLVIMITGISVVIEGKWTDAVYLGLQAFILAEFAAAFEWQIQYFIFMVTESNTPVSRYLPLILIYGGVFSIAFLIFRGKRGEEKKNIAVSGSEIAMMAVMTAITFALSNLPYVNVLTPFSVIDGNAVGIIRMLVDLSGVLLIDALFLQRRQMQAREEIASMKYVLQNQYMQYQQSRESIELINYKYHDLKHQIAILRNDMSNQERNACLDEIMEGIQTYEAQNKTGNQVVDTILTGKTMLCEMDHIEMTSVVDGKLLDFMSTMDICSLLGNALDNAIEAERQIEQTQKRLIHVAIFSQKQFVILRFENYVQQDTNGKVSQLKTTKSDPEFHGYGIKSIRHVAEKYGGMINVSVRDHWFELQVLLPEHSQEEHFA